MRFSVIKEVDWEVDDRKQGISSGRKVKTEKYHFILACGRDTSEAKARGNEAPDEAERSKDHLELKKQSEEAGQFTELSCFVCGKTRSDDYHQKHPVKRGENPIPSLCHRCRQDRKLRIADRGRVGSRHRRANRLYAHIDNKQWCSNCGVLRSQHYHEMYMTTDLPPWSEICGKCKKSVEKEGKQELSRLLCEESMTTKRSSVEEDTRGHQHNQRLGRPYALQPDPLDRGDNVASSESLAPGILAKDGSRDDVEDLEPLNAASAASYENLSGVASSVKDYQALNTQTDVPNTMSKERTLDDMYHTTLSERRDRPEQHQNAKPQQFAKPLEPERAQHQPEKLERGEHHNPPTAPVNSAKKRREHKYSCFPRYREQVETSQFKPKRYPKPKPEPRHTQQRDDEHEPAQSCRMGVSDMYWASEEGAYLRTLAGEFGFWEFQPDHYYDGDKINTERGPGYDGAAPAAMDNPAESFSSATGSGSSEEDATSSSSGKTSPELAESYGHFSAAATTQPWNAESLRSGVPSPFEFGLGQPSYYNNSDNNNSRIWEVDSVTAGEIEKAHAVLAGGKGKAKAKSMGKSKGRGKDN
ncbi:hypothetical protein N656DRAFT_841022 [Canariomyces notabilis]|uniref:Stc1 domain-containing protein n=1 Tax=Canariomyces notabilis TaxID=2074819 RepID=A0AAN6TMN6_9PEZI|nr:hypothetical protein N656DRAFT_841022 [Canariomyces arenarius]